MAMAVDTFALFDLDERLTIPASEKVPDEDDITFKVVTVTANYMGKYGIRCVIVFPNGVSKDEATLKLKGRLRESVNANYVIRHLQELAQRVNVTLSEGGTVAYDGKVLDIHNV